MNIASLFRPASEHVNGFMLIYGNPSKTELDTLEHLAKMPIDDRSRIYRAIIGSYDHQVLRTPFTVRFSEQDVAYTSMHGFELAVDALDFSVSQPLASGRADHSC